MRLDAKHKRRPLREHFDPLIGDYVLGRAPRELSGDKRYENAPDFGALPLKEIEKQVRESSGADRISFITQVSNWLGATKPDTTEGIRARKVYKVVMAALKPKVERRGRPKSDLPKVVKPRKKSAEANRKDCAAYAATEDGRKAKREADLRYQRKKRRMKKKVKARKRVEQIHLGS